MRLSTLLRRPCPAIPRRCNDLRELCPSRRRKRLAPATSVSVGRDQSPDTPSRGALMPNRGGSKTPPTPPRTAQDGGHRRGRRAEPDLGLRRRVGFAEANEGGPPPPCRQRHESQAFGVDDASGVGEKSCVDPLTTGGDEMLGPHRRAGTRVGRQPG